MFLACCEPPFPQCFVYVHTLERWLVTSLSPLMRMGEAAPNYKRARAVSIMAVNRSNKYRLSCGPGEDSG